MLIPKSNLMTFWHSLKPCAPTEALIILSFPQRVSL